MEDGSHKPLFAKDSEIGKEPFLNWEYGV